MSGSYGLRFCRVCVCLLYDGLNDLLVLRVEDLGEGLVEMRLLSLKFCVRAEELAFDSQERIVGESSKSVVQTGKQQFALLTHEGILEVAVRFDLIQGSFDQVLL